MDSAEQMVGRGGLINESEFITVIMECLHSLGYKQSANLLEMESGVSWKSKELRSLESLIRNTNWEGCIDILDKIDGVTNDARISALFAVCELYLLEYSHCNISSSLDVLQKNIVKLAIGEENVRKLSCYLLSKVETDKSGIEDLQKKLLPKLQEILPPPIGFPQRRLEYLIERAFTFQIDRCLYHNTANLSVYRDHNCLRDHFPTETIQILTDHKDEVWFVQFSNSGRYLASSSSDCTAIIWEVQDDNKVTQKHKLTGHTKPISFLAWSPDDTMLLTCGYMEVVNLWDVETGVWKQKFGDESFIVSSCAWFHGSESILCGSSDPIGGLCLWHFNGELLRSWEGNRVPKVMDLVVTPDRKYLIVLFHDKWIRIWKVPTTAGGDLNESLVDERMISEYSVTSLSVSGDSESFIVNLNNQQIHMWDVRGIREGPIIFDGHRQQIYVIRSCFGGLNSSFIASGSEDSKVYIWACKSSSSPLKILSGHSKTVNCVSWNPQLLQMLASASDDGTIRIWAPKPKKI